MKKFYWIIGIVILLAGVVLGWIFLKKTTNGEYQWKTAVAEQGDLRVTVTATGSLQAVTTVQVGTQVSGTISKIMVDFNDYVKQGQVIAVLDTTYLAQAVEDASASLQRADIQVNQTKREHERNKQLFEQKVISESEYDVALSSYETAVSSARSARASLTRAKINLRYATIEAPISGVVVSRAVDVGQTVAASFNTPTLFTIANDLTKMQVQASIDEADIGKIKVGQEVTFTVDAYDNQTFSGQVKQIRLLPVVTQNVVNYTVIIDVPNPDLKLLPGMTANISVLVEQATDVMKVPSAALKFTPPQEVIDKAMAAMPDSVRQRWEKMPQSRSHGGSQGGGVMGSGGPPSGPGGMQGSSGGQAGGDNRRVRQGGLVWVLEGENVVPKRVRTGLTDGSFTEIRSKSLEPGDTVITGMTGGSTSVQANSQQNNPFAPQMPRGGRR